ncbi:glycosyltransferase [Pediococcus stilesii]|uniref:glycosyltransferase n=1 Tax=Pediococcus stilesii TaxID=331679 RepID=UPI001BB2C4AA|nr:glycosyltransferase family 2 protein [Pediococcus stilesii]
MHFNVGIQHAQFDYVLGIDADSIIDSNAIDQLIFSLKQNPQMGGITGRPQVINRDKLVEKMQSMEYTAIIDLIKRSQTFFTGNILTISGVIAMFRKDAVLSINGWNPNVQTEDIDITWRLSQKGFSVGYNPNALTWILVPSTFKSLLRQRRRWAYGGLQMLLTNKIQLLKPFQMKSLLLYEMILSIFWSFTTVFSIAFFFVNIYLAQELHLDGNIILMIILMGLIQFLVGLSITQKTSQIRWFIYLYIPLYLFYYWIINLYALITSVFKMVYMPDNNGKWVSPQRIINNKEVSSNAGEN